MGLSLFRTTGRANKERAEFVSALPYSHSYQRSGCSSALPYPLYEYFYFIISEGGLIFNINMGPFSILIFCYNYPKWVQFQC